MIKANELRIGNYLHDFHGQLIVEVTWDIIKDLQQNIKFHPPKPIPLTPEILEKAGFKKDENKANVFSNGNELLIEVTEKGFQSVIESDWPELIDIGNPIHYLHQLQNLYFALTGTELEVNL